MLQVKKFDVLIVYSGTIAVSAKDKSKNRTPFPLGSKNESCNTAYAYFLDRCQQLGLKTAFTTSQDIVGAGVCQSYWSITNMVWHKHRNLCSAPLIFDKFSPKNASDRTRRKLLFSSKTVRPFNDPLLRHLFFDKQKTYDELSEHTIPTFSLLGPTLAHMHQACDTLATTMRTHPASQDFSQDIIMKDRYGAGGWNVYKFKPGEAADMDKTAKCHPETSFVLQPFARFDQGYTNAGVAAATDIRLIYLGGKIVESYLRVAKPNDFRCNEHQGGTLTYLALKDIPPKILTKAAHITKKLKRGNALYSLDFIMSNRGNVYLLEGNTGPGLDWNLAVKKEEVNAKKFIRRIVHELADRVRFV